MVREDLINTTRAILAKAGYDISAPLALRSVCFALGPAPEVGTGPDGGLEVAGGRAWVRALGSFLPEVFSASRSGGGDPRADRGRRVCGPPRGVRSPEPSPGTHAFSLSKS